MVRVEDFDRFIFIVGAPRCGTTTLSQFLKDHPAVRFARIKEPHFFARHDLRDLSDEDLRAAIERDYLSRFFGDAAGRRIGADGSVSYLYRPERLEPAVRLWPDARFIIGLRNPLTMLPSLHRRLVYIGDESLPSFEQAWRAAPERAAGRRIPRNCADPNFLRYDEAARFGSYVERLFDAVGRERCLPMIFDDLANDPEAQYRRVLDFCGLEFVPRTEFRVHRKGSAVRLRWLQRLLKRPPQALRDYVVGEQFPLRSDRPERGFKRSARKAILSTRERLLEWNRTDAPQQPLAPELRRELHGKLRGEIERLSDLLGRDLTHWLRADEASG